MKCRTHMLVLLSAFVLLISILSSKSLALIPYTPDRQGSQTISNIATFPSTDYKNDLFNFTTGSCITDYSDAYGCDLVESQFYFSGANVVFNYTYADNIYEDILISPNVDEYLTVHTYFPYNYETDEKNITIVLHIKLNDDFAIAYSMTYTEYAKYLWANTTYCIANGLLVGFASDWTLDNSNKSIITSFSKAAFPYEETIDPFEICSITIQSETSLTYCEYIDLLPEFSEGTSQRNFLFDVVETLNNIGYDLDSNYQAMVDADQGIDNSDQDIEDDTDQDQPQDEMDLQERNLIIVLIIIAAIVVSVVIGLIVSFRRLSKTIKPNSKSKSKRVKK